VGCLGGRWRSERRKGEKLERKKSPTLRAARGKAPLRYLSVSLTDPGGSKEWASHKRRKGSEEEPQIHYRIAPTRAGKAKEIPVSYLKITTPQGGRTEVIKENKERQCRNQELNRPTAQRGKRRRSVNKRRKRREWLKRRGARHRWRTWFPKEAESPRRLKRRKAKDFRVKCPEGIDTKSLLSQFGAGRGIGGPEIGGVPVFL